MPKVFIFSGLPASGKSTEAKKIVVKDGNTVRINKDDLRTMLIGGHWTQSREKNIVAARDALLQSFMNRGLNIIVDDTNLNPTHTKRMKDLVNAHNKTSTHTYTIDEKFFDVDVEEAVKRDLARPASVGRDVIEDMYYKWIFHPESVEHVEGAPKAVIFDMDGTLSLLNGRSPYDFHLCYDDPPNKPVVDACNMYAVLGWKIIVVSGRDDSCKELTQKWLDKHGILNIELFMRVTGDTRPDYIAKSEIFDKYIRGNYNIHAVFDDRNQVVRYWRSIGLPTFQVNYGNF